MQPTEDLMTEHRAIERMLAILEAISGRLEEGEATDARHLEQIIEFLQVFGDRCHHAKEEDLLLPAMEDAGVPREGLIAALPTLHLPVLLVRGMQSELVHEDYAREFVSLAPSASYVDVGGAGHMVAGDRNDVFCNAVLDFLTDREAA